MSPKHGNSDATDGINLNKSSATPDDLKNPADLKNPTDLEDSADHKDLTKNSNQKDAPSDLEVAALSRRELAREKLANQLKAEADRAKKTRTTIISLVLISALAIAGVITFFTMKHFKDEKFKAEHIDCTYSPAADVVQAALVSIKQALTKPGNAADREKITKILNQYTAGEAKARKSAIPDGKSVRRVGTTAVELKTSLGPVELLLDRASAPCAIGAVTSLAKANYFDNTECLVLVRKDEKVAASYSSVICGDPTHLGLGNPGWSYAAEPATSLPLSSTPGPTGQPGYLYKRGTIIMFPSSGTQPNEKIYSSQMMFIMKDTEMPTQNPVVGSVTPAGLAILDKVYAAGPKSTDPNEPVDSTRPKLPFTILDANIK